MFDFLKIAEKIKEAKAEMEAAQQVLAQQTFTGEAGGGLVKAHVRGNRRLVAIDIDPQLLSQSEQETVQDLVVAATNLALKEAEVAMKVVIKERSSGFCHRCPAWTLVSFSDGATGSRCLT